MCLGIYKICTYIHTYMYVTTVERRGHKFEREQREVYGRGWRENMMQLYFNTKIKEIIKIKMLSRKSYLK